MTNETLAAMQYNHFRTARELLADSLGEDKDYQMELIKIMILAAHRHMYYRDSS